MAKPLYKCILLVIPLFFFASINAQMITGTWKGRINRQKVEVKIIQKGDSLTGTSYYYESAGNFRRYSIKGYFDAFTNEAVWWDDQLLEEKSGRFSISTPGKMPLLSRADFNCPGGGKMMLDGKSVDKNDKSDIKGDVHLDKSGKTFFPDEWDFVIDNYTIGANDPDLIDSIALLALHPVTIIEKPVPDPETPPAKKRPPTVNYNTNTEKQVVSSLPEEKKTITIIKEEKQTPPPTIEEKFSSREKKFIKEIPLTGDSIELRFYDNAEIDGDSVSLFLNNKLFRQHIRLTSNAYVMKLALIDLADTNELTMVAENLGAIPPNTAYLVAIINEQRYDAYLASTEGSSATIRLLKKIK